MTVDRLARTAGEFCALFVVSVNSVRESHSVRELREKHACCMKNARDCGKS